MNSMHFHVPDSGDRELNTIHLFVVAMDILCDAERERIVRYLADRYSVMTP